MLGTFEALKIPFQAFAVVYLLHFLRVLLGPGLTLQEWIPISYAVFKAFFARAWARCIWRAWLLGFLVWYDQSSSRSGSWETDCAVYLYLHTRVGSCANGGSVPCSHCLASGRSLERHDFVQAICQSAYGRRMPSRSRPLLEVSSQRQLLSRLPESRNQESRTSSSKLTYHFV